MINTDYFRDKLVTIIGLARSGTACANLLYDLGAQVSVTEIRHDNTALASKRRLKSDNIKTELGRHSREFIEGRDLVIISPGITDDAKPVLWAKELKVPVISEIEVGWILCAGSVIAVTGSNGKTTVATLISKVIEAAGKKAHLCGNIGNPFCLEVAKVENDDFVVLEVSSFQLEKIERFRPKIAVILNFSRNHLDRYKDMQEYLAAKKRIFMNQEKSDYLVLNKDDPALINLPREAKSSHIYFSKKRGLNPNQAAVLAVAQIMEIDKRLCLEEFFKFRGIEHRLELVDEINNITFINDSKATTVESAIWALNNISRPIIWIAGGKHKKLDYKSILELADKKVKSLVLIGEAKEKIKKALGGCLTTEYAADLKEAVHKSFALASKGDCVLLSPMCSSFDMFSDYEERGRFFKQAVADLAKSKIPR